MNELAYRLYYTAKDDGANCVGSMFVVTCADALSTAQAQIRFADLIGFHTNVAEVSVFAIDSLGLARKGE